MTNVRRLLSLTALLLGLLPGTALAQFNSQLIDFNGSIDEPIDDPATSQEMFRSPEVSGSSAGFVQLNTAGFDKNWAYRANNGFQSEGAAGLWVRWLWSDPNNPSADPNNWVRLTTLSGADRPNPSLHLGGKVRFKVTNVGNFAFGSIGICLGIRETGANVPMLADGGTGGTLEWVGATGVITDNLATPVRPIPAVILPLSPFPVELEFDLATGNVTVDGSPVAGGIQPFTGDGVLSAPNNRGVLEHIAFVRVAGEFGAEISLTIDELQFESPVADPVLPPSIIEPMVNGDPTIRITDFQAGVNQITVFKNGNPTAIITQAVSDPNTIVELNLPVAAATNETYTARQRVGAITSGDSNVAKVFALAPAFGMSVLVDEDGDGGCSFTAPGGWEMLGATSITGVAGGDIYPTGKLLPLDAAVWQTVDFDFAGPLTGWLGGNGTLDPSPTGFRSIESLWFDLANGQPAGSYSIYLDAIELLDPNNNVLATIHDFEDGINYMTSTRGQSTVNAATTTVVTSTIAYRGRSSHLLGWTYATAVQEALGQLTRVGLQCGTQPQWPDTGSKIRVRYHARGAAINGLPIPAVTGPIVKGTQTSVRVTNDSTASSVQLFVNGVAAGAPIVPSGTITDFAGVTLNPGDSVSATQVIGGVESDFALPQGVSAAPNAPAITTPLGPGTSVTVTGLYTTQFATASQIQISVNGGAAQNFTPTGASTTVTLSSALVTGDTVVARQVVNGATSPDSAVVVVSIPAPVIYAAPASGGSTVRVLNLWPTADSVTVKRYDPIDEPGTAVNFNAVIPPGATFVDVPVSGLTVGLRVKASQTDNVGPAVSPESVYEAVTVAGNTPIFSDDFENSAAFPTTWPNLSSGGLTLSTAQNSTVGGVQSAFNNANSGRVATNAFVTKVIPSETDPLVWNVNIYDSFGPSPGSSVNQFAQFIEADTGFLAHIGLSNLATPQATNFYQFRAVFRGGPNWINLNQFQAPQRSIGWHTFTMIQKGLRIDIYVDGLLAAKNITLTSLPDYDQPRIGPGAGVANTITGWYDDYILERGAVRFGTIAPQPPTIPSVLAPIEDGDTAVGVGSLSASVTQVQIIDAGNVVIGTYNGSPDPNTAEATVTLTRPLVAQELIKARATNVVGSADSANMEVGQGNGDLRLSLGIRETADGGALGTPGSGVGAIEWIGPASAVSGAPQGKPISPSNAWQTVTFNPGTDPILSFSAGDGILASANNRGTIEHLAIAVDSASPDRSSGTYEVYIDNIVNVGADGGLDFLVEDFEGLTLGTEAVFQEPTFSGSTAANLAPLPSASQVSADFGNPGQSQKLTFFFKDTTAARWSRVTTSGVANTPAPIIDLTKAIRLDVLIRESAGIPGDLDGDGDVDLDDLLLVLGSFGDPGPGSTGDADGDGDTDLDDLLLVLGNFGAP